MKKRPIIRRSKTILWIFLAAILAFAIGFRAGQTDLEKLKANPASVIFKNSQPPSEVTVDVSPFWEAWQKISGQYIGRANIDQNKMLSGAISGLVASLGDPYSAYLTKDESETMKEELNGKYEGVGIELGFRDSKIVIIAPISGSPAQKAGVKPGDEIVSIDGQKTEGMNIAEATKLIRGSVGSKVILELKDTKGAINKFEIRREQISVKSVEVQFLQGKNGDVALIKLSRFGEQTNNEWDTAVSEILKRQVKGVILDVRSNPGGFLTGAGYVASEFLEGRIYGTQEANGEKNFFQASRKGKLLDVPLAVLIDKGSASASEIVAGAISTRGRGKLVGEASFGKGSVQNAIDLKDGGSVLITVEKWLLPTGDQISKDGLKPDFEVKTDQIVSEAKDDPVVKKAIDIL